MRNTIEAYKDAAILFQITFLQYEDCVQLFKMVRDQGSSWAVLDDSW